MGAMSDNERVGATCACDQSAPYARLCAYCRVTRASDVKQYNASEHGRIHPVDLDGNLIEPNRATPKDKTPWVRS